jgi:hypothetical protein
MQRLGKWLVACGAASLCIGTGTAFANASSPVVGLMFSATSDHAAPKRLAHASLPGAGTVFLGGSASGIKSVSYRIDDATGARPTQSLVATAPFDFHLDAAALPSGIHTLLAVVTDNRGLSHDLFARFSVRAATAPVADTASATCIKAAGTTLKDQDPTDSPEAPWAHSAGQPITVYYQIGSLSARYTGFVKTGVATWSKSPCIKAVSVAACPTNSNCVKVVESATAGDGSTDGDSTGNDSGGIRTGDTINLYTDLLSGETDNGALATTVHEMGHSLGLIHRLNKADLMNADTSDTTVPAPDAIDFANLAVIYGK